MCLLNASFKETRNLVLECYVGGISDKDDFMLLYDTNQSKNPEFSHENYKLFNFDALDLVECVADFRVEKQDISRLADALGIPLVIKHQQRSICDGTEGLCMLLRRFAYPFRLSDMIARFGRPVPVMTMITKEVMNFIYNNHQQRLTQCNQFLLSPASLQEYANAIHRAGAALDNCFGFIDGTLRAISRPGKDQRLVYNGHKRVHALKFQSVSLPNGIIANLFGLVGVSSRNSMMNR